MNSNLELNKLEIYKDKKCIHCHRKYPGTVLNIEGVIHHKREFICVDTKSCNKAKKKL